MKFAALTSLLAAVSVSALPSQEVRDLETESRAVTTSTCGKYPFHLMSLRSASPIHFGDFSASKGSIYINLPEGKQAATCDGNPHNQATFYIKDGGLYLYHAGNGKKQQIFVDRSGMGQGVLGYIPSGSTPPRNAELTGWKTVKSGDYKYLNFNDADLLACPSSDGAYSLWVNAGNANPGGNKNCLGFSAMVINDEDPVSCRYTKQ